ncbi:hypothetical protein UFOVP594_18 [uncultured Caudovirales phage]|uniref:Phage protein n=1 Tax=uncultured Caudovirales phage TaxID=2100421 RepID=A0A6J5MZS2_9CAUD|nr:hypothetical protein UFOVP594_18 [uncultured Caudovirales phage]
MNADRETKTITIGGHEVVMKTYASAIETQSIKHALYRGAKMEMSGETPKISDFNFAAQDEVEKEMVNQLVISIDGDTANILTRALDWPNVHYQELVQELDLLTGKKK